VTFSTNIPGREKIEAFSMKGVVKEAPAAKIVVQPRRIVLNEAELNAGKEQTLSISNQGLLPLIITRIRSKDGNTVYFDGEKEGNIVIESNQTKTVQLRLAPDKGKEKSQDFIILDSNAKNAGKTGYFLVVQYGSAGN
jgi:hypothetical protein